MLLLSLLLACGSPEAPPPLDPELPAATRATPVVVLVVLDTVRADHTSLCGYDRPTTPFLAQVAGRPTVSHTCDAYAPGTWTIPSHVGFFTGLPVPEHGSRVLSVSEDLPVPLLAEVMRERGYRTALVSANPTLSHGSGLHRGFDEVGVASDLLEGRGQALTRKVWHVLGRFDPDEPLFLVVNIFDAHDPYPEIPEGVGWVPPRPSQPLDALAPERDRRYHRFARGELPPDEVPAYLQAITDTYDWGIHEADASLRRLMVMLDERGFLRRDHRIVVTSDHGEFLGEHQLLRHGCYPWQPVVRVPLVFYESARTEPLPLPSPLSGTEVFGLVADGALSGAPALSFSEGRPDDVRGCADLTALWPSVDEKLMSDGREAWRIDLAADPGETSPAPLGEHGAAGALEAQARRHVERLARKRAEVERREELGVLGYVE